MEINSANFLALALAPTGAGPVDATPPAAAVAAPEAQRFRSLMEAPVAGPEFAVEGRMDVGRPLLPAAPPANLGEAILRGIDEVRANFRQNWDAVTSLGGPDQPAPGPQELFRFQLKVIESSFQYEMVGKVVSKAEQNLEQIVKMQ